MRAAPATGDKELLAHLQRRVAAFDAERADLLARLEACAGPPPSEVYRIQAENRKRAEEVRELQKALSDAHTYLYEERERLLAVQAENDGLRLQELEDRARIKQLLALTRPVEQRAARGGGGENAGPQPAALFPRSPRHGGRGGRAAGGCGSSGSAGAAAAGAAAAAGGPARIVYVDAPAVQGEALALKCEALQAQLAEQKRFAAERVAALQEDRAIRERDAAAHVAALSAAAEELAAKLAAAEEALRCTTKDYILAKQDRAAAEAEAAAARAAAAAEARAAAEALAAAKAEAADRVARLRRELGADRSAVTKELAAQLQQRSEELVKFEALHHLIRGQLEARAAEAERRAGRLGAQARALRQRRAHEMEGWAADVSQLRKRIAGVERQLRQQALLQRLPDGDVRDAALARHARLASTQSTSQDVEYELGMDELVEELLAIKGGLLGMGERVRRQAALEGVAGGGGSGGGGGVDAFAAGDSTRGGSLDSEAY